MYLVFTEPKRSERSILLPHYIFGKYFLLATQENIDKKVTLKLNAQGHLNALKRMR